MEVDSCGTALGEGGLCVGALDAGSTYAMDSCLGKRAAVGTHRVVFYISVLDQGKKGFLKALYTQLKMPQTEIGVSVALYDSFK